MCPVDLRLRFLTIEPLAGVILSDGGEVAFDGWAGLAGALQAALVPANHRTPSGPADQASSAAASPPRPGTSSFP